ncbi:hypothetical protein HGRIS_011931 [Hohenbuehelia grisea]|uniref:Uncharacterized protein n=1 Tax=Hohenbuehelia grisea TaxID=104357 RepID=A0ABR3JWK5_9AGAR
MDVFFVTNRKTGPFYRVDRSGQVSSDYELYGDDSRRLDNPTCYLYHVSRLGTLGGALVVMPTTCTKKPRTGCAGFVAALVSAPGLRAELAVQSADDVDVRFAVTSHAKPLQFDIYVMVAAGQEPLDLSHAGGELRHVMED